MSLAVGGIGQSKVRRGPHWVDVTDFGARADGATDNTAAFQAAVDHVAARIAATVTAEFRTVGTVFVPAAVGKYMLSRPVWVDSPYIEVVGEGQGTRISAYPETAHPLFIFGLRRRATTRVDGQDVEMKADHAYRPDLHGKLDATAAPQPGVRWGFRSHGDALIQSQASSMSVGCRSLRGDYTADNWTETRKLTIEFAVEGPDEAPIPAGSVLFGMGVATSDVAYPFVVYMHDSSTIGVLFDTQPVTFGDHRSHKFFFPLSGPLGVHRVAVQFDLDAGTVAAFVDGTQVATTNHFDPSWGPGQRFAENDCFPLLIADGGGNRPSLGNPNGFDFSLYGLLFSREIRYQNHGPGQTQLRRDDPALPIDDRYRYFTPRSVDLGMIGHLAFTEDPATCDRLLAVTAGEAGSRTTGSAFLIHHRQILPGGILDNAIRDLHLIGGNLYGQNIAVAQVLEMSITGIRSSGAYHGIGSLSNSANYTVRVENCALNAQDSGYFGLNQGVWIRNTTFQSSGRATMRFAGCNVNVENCFVSFRTANSQSTIKIHSSDYGGNYSFKNITVDYEGDTYLHTAVYCEAHPYVPATSLRLTDVYLGTIGDASLIELKDMQSWFPPGLLFVENLQTYTQDMKAVLSLEGPKWRGEVKGLAVGEAPRVIHSGKNGQGSGVVVRDTTSGRLPRTRYWCAGAHRIEVGLPADGQFAEWRCVESGAYGTPAPPIWVGHAPSRFGANPVAAYVTNHGYITATLT